jgi:hypothetical protein
VLQARGRCIPAAIGEQLEKKSFGAFFVDADCIGQEFGHMAHIRSHLIQVPILLHEVQVKPVHVGQFQVFFGGLEVTGAGDDRQFRVAIAQVRDSA